MVLTGFLGAGKTTLLNRILSGDGGRRYAVIVNEFGEIGIDGDLIVSTEEELIEMNNGCICCSVRGDLVRTLHQLLSRPGAFDCIVIETTGVANPGPVIQTFFIDHVLKARIVLDSVTTVVDAAHIGLHLADTPVAAEQIAFADQIILNKTELVSGAELKAMFWREYIERTAPWQLERFETESRDGKVRCRARLLRDGQPVEFAGEGNGPLAALVHGFGTAGVPRFEITDYSEHALSAGEEAAAIAYIRIKDGNGSRHWGAGVDTNIELASVKAVLSALNRTG